MTCPPSLLRLPFLRKGELVARKQGRCAQKASAGKELAAEILTCFRRMRRAHRAPGLRRAPFGSEPQGRRQPSRRAPLQRNYPVLGKRTACPPDPENESCLMVFARNALAFGPGNGRNSIGLTTACRKVKVGNLSIAGLAASAGFSALADPDGFVFSRAKPMPAKEKTKAGWTSLGGEESLLPPRVADDGF